MANSITVAQVDAIIDAHESDPAEALADLLDNRGAWDWTDESEHDPSDRLAVLESSGAYWLVYRGTESDEATRFASEREALSALKEQSEQITA